MMAMIALIMLVGVQGVDVSFVDLSAAGIQPKARSEGGAGATNSTAVFVGGYIVPAGNPAIQIDGGEMSSRVLHQCSCPQTCEPSCSHGLLDSRSYTKLNSV